MTQFRPITKIQYGIQWLLIYNRTVGCGNFANETEALFSLVPGKYSILRLVDDSFREGKMFEFLLQYPSAERIQWKQSENPILESDFEKTQVNDFTEVDIHQNAKESFKGLARRTRNSTSGFCIPTLLYGEIGEDTWYYGIGEYSNCITDFDITTGDPGTKIPESQCLLWIKITRRAHILWSCTHSSSKHYFYYSFLVFLFIKL